MDTRYEALLCSPGLDWLWYDGFFIHSYGLRAGRPPCCGGVSDPATAPGLESSLLDTVIGGEGNCGSSRTAAAGNMPGPFPKSGGHSGWNMWWWWWCHGPAFCCSSCTQLGYCCRGGGGTWWWWEGWYPAGGAYQEAAELAGWWNCGGPPVEAVACCWCLYIDKGL
jgi:hypothetical protein